MKKKLKTLVKPAAWRHAIKSINFAKKLVFKYICMILWIKRVSSNGTRWTRYWSIVVLRYNGMRDVEITLFAKIVRCKISKYMDPHFAISPRWNWRMYAKLKNEMILIDTTPRYASMIEDVDVFSLQSCLSQFIFYLYLINVSIVIIYAK